MSGNWIRNTCEVPEDRLVRRELELEVGHESGEDDFWVSRRSEGGLIGREACDSLISSWENLNPLDASDMDEPTDIAIEW